MNHRQLLSAGVPEYAISEAQIAMSKAIARQKIRGKKFRQIFQELLASPESYLDDPDFGRLAQILISEPVVEENQPISYKTWGSEIDQLCHQQMQDACRLPGAFGAALMPDAHVGYGLPIGGVLAMENRVIPYAVGVDIACRMKLSILDLPVGEFDKRIPQYKTSLENGTRFGIGCEWDKPQHHEVMDHDWSVTKVTRQNQDKAWKQLGTSGSGNHFVEFGIVTLSQPDLELGLEAGQYVALLSHSGSRGTGASVCSTYSSIAQSRLSRSQQNYGRLAWLDLETQAGQEYWAAMNLMGEYAAANHAVIHRNVTKLIGGRIIAGVENHHNFAWKEIHNGKEVIVHRKGATPAGKGVLGVIPGSMADPAFVVRGKGNPESLNSASHGAGRCMSRTQALSQFNFKATRNSLEKRGIHILSAGADEVPSVYKNILSVMDQQQDLVEIVARFDPKVVKMCGDGSKSED